MKMPQCNADCFQIFLNELSIEKQGQLNIMVLDNGAFHKAKKLNIPENILLVFLPPYAPELNPAEKMWAKFKRDFTNHIYLSMEQISDFIKSSVDTRSEERRVGKECRSRWSPYH